MPEFVYEKDCVLIDDEHADTILQQHLDADVDHERGAPGVGLYRIGGETAVDAVNRLNQLESLRDKASVNHLVSICPVELCPADEPVPLPVDASQDPYPPVTGAGGKDVSVTVVDTGRFTGYEIGHPWLAQGVTGEHRTADPALADADPWPRGLVPEYYGHGVFVAGVLKCAAPQAKIAMINGFPFAGATMEDMLGTALNNALASTPDIISVSAGSMTMDDKSHLALKRFFSELTKPDCTTLLVAAAGNHGTPQRFWPAAYAKDAPSAVVSVGALRSDGNGRACFSAYGTADDDWVSVYALGERHINAFAAGGYAYVDPQRPDLTCRYYPDERLYPTCTCVTMPPQGAVVAFRGMAQWSGTSFATPLVAGIIASYMSTHKTGAREAAQAVLRQAEAIADHGITLRALRNGISGR